jgi:hypothetical protein
MSQRLQDGLILDPSVYIIDEKKSGFPIIARIFQLLALLIGSWSAISILQECLNIPSNYMYVNLALILSCVVAFILLLIPSYDLVKLFFVLLFYGLYLFSRLARLKNAFYIIENLILKRIYEYYGYTSQLYIADYDTAGIDTSLLVIMVLIPMVALLAVSIMRSKYIGGSSLILFLPVSVSFLFGLIPSEQYLVAYIIAMLYLTRSGYSGHHGMNQEQHNLLHRINSKAAVWLSLIGVLIFFLAKLLVSPQNYEKVAEIKEIKKDIQTAMYDFSLEEVTDRFTSFGISGNKVAVGGLDGGKLGGTGEVTFQNVEQLHVTAPYASVKEGIYLKGYVGSDYQGDRWEEHSEDVENEYKELKKSFSDEEFLPINQVGRMFKQSSLGENGPQVFPELKFSYGKMKVEYTLANKKFMYAPYFTDYELLNNLMYEQDLYAKPRKKKKEYEFNYYYGISLDNTNLNMINSNDSQTENSVYEKLYRDFVYRVYTRLPDKGIERLKKEFSSINTPTKGEDVLKQIDYVKNYLSQNTLYSLSPGKLPEGKDFVEYFLFENKVGYCAHYASTATLILRTMGIPARYVEGYATGETELLNATTDGKETRQDRMVELSVKDYNAHAWVEVYMDSCGWVPVEFTPGYMFDYNNTVTENLAQIGDQLNQYEDELMIEPTKIPEKITPTQAVAPEQEQQEDQIQKRGSLQADNKVTAATQKKNDKFMLLFGMVLILMAILVTMFRLYLTKKKRRTDNYNRRAIILYSDMEKMLAFENAFPKRGVPLEDCMEYVKNKCNYIDPLTFENTMGTVYKARYGRESISRDELQLVESFQQGLFVQIYEKSTFHKKLFLKFVLGI